MKRLLLASSFLTAFAFGAPQVEANGHGGTPVYAVRPAFERIGNPRPARPMTSMSKNQIVAFIAAQSFNVPAKTHIMRPEHFVPQILVSTQSLGKGMSNKYLELTKPFRVGEREARIVARLDKKGRPNLEVRFIDNAKKVSALEAALGKAKVDAAKPRKDNLWGQARQQVADANVARLGKKLKAASAEWSRTISAPVGQFRLDDKQRRFILLNEVAGMLDGSGGLLYNQELVKSKLVEAARTLKAFRDNPDRSLLKPMDAGYSPGYGFAERVEKEYLSGLYQ